MVFVEGTAAEQVRAVPAELDAEAGHQAFQRDFPFEPLDLVVGNTRHSKTSSKAGFWGKPVK